MAVDGLSRRYVVWVPLAGVPANSPAVFMLHGCAGRKSVPPMDLG